MPFPISIITKCSDSIVSLWGGKEKTPGFYV